MKDEIQDDPRIGRTRGRVVEAALELLAEGGPEAVTHQRVAEEAGIGRATVYRHWPDRWDLIRDSLESLSLALEPPEGAKLRDRLIDMVEKLCDRFESPLSFALSSLIAQAEWEGAARTFLTRLMEHASKNLQRSLAEAAGSEGIRFDLPVETIQAILVGPFVYERFVMGKVRSRKRIPAMVDGLLNLRRR